MAERYFLGLLVVLISISAVWLSLVEPVIYPELFLAGILALFGLATVANTYHVSKSSFLMPIFFIATIAYSAYIYLTNPIGYLLASISLLGLTGLVVSFAISP